MDLTALKLAAAAFKSALQQQDRQALVAAAQRLLELDAPIGQQWQGLAQEVFRWGELELALKGLNAWHRSGAPAAVVNYEKAILLSRAGLTSRAETLAKALPDDMPSPAANAYLRGALAVSRGGTREAERHFRRAIRARPDSGRSWQGVAQYGSVSESDYAAMLALSRATAFEEEEDRAAVENALGLVEHKKGNHAAAFGHFDRSTRIARDTRPYDRFDNEKSAAIASAWRAGTIAKLRQAVSADERRPIFVTGLARSGTTLAQQILTAHSAVDGGGELGLAMQVEAMADGFAPEDFERYLTQGGSLEQLRATYLRLVGERIPGAGMFVDKSLNQSRSLGPYSVLFPDAPVLWLRRDPLANAWSIFRTWMSRSAVAGWTLEDIAHHMKLEDALLEHWQRELGDRLLVVRYEDLVDDPRGWTERITRHCGLEVERQQFEFHRTARSVTTASALQVRQPINRAGIGAADPYRPFLKPFIDAYGG